MDCLRQAYPTVPDHFLETALIKAELDVIDALGLLRLDFGEPSDDESSDDEHLFPGPRFFQPPKSQYGQPESSRSAAATFHSDGPSALQTYIAVRAFFPYVTFDYIQKTFNDWPGPIPQNINQLITKRLFFEAQEIEMAENVPKRASDQFIDLDADLLSIPDPPPITTVPAGPVDCGCCYTECPEDEITQCENSVEPHHFCFTCATKNAAAEIGKGKFLLKCMDTSGCTATFTDAEIRRFLDEKTYNCLDRIRTQSALAEAGLVDLVNCPFCDFAAIMEDPEDTIFECQNELCGIRSCRTCRVSHHPRTCEQYRTENKISAKHAVEEAMTAALVRNCNACNKPFYKEEGCNQMTCPCGNKQCFVCSLNVRGYDHFDRTEDNSGPQDCPMFDNTVERLRQEVAAAQVHAVQEAMQERTDLTEADLTVDPNLIGGNRGIQNGGDVMERVRTRLDQQMREREVREQQEEAARLATELDQQLREERARERERNLRARRERVQRQAAARRAQRLERERIQRERLEVERLEEEMRELQRLDQIREETQRREDEEAVEAVLRFERQQQLEEERRIQEAVRATVEDQKWDALLTKRAAFVGEYHLQDLPPYEVETYWAERQQHLRSCIDDMHEFVAYYAEMFAQGMMSETAGERYGQVNAMLAQSVRQLDMFVKEAKVRQKENQKEEKRKHKEAADALKQRVKERKQERKGLAVTAVTAVKVRPKSKLLFWKKS